MPDLAPWRAARRILYDRDDLTPPDATIARLTLWRSVVGVGCTVYLTAGHRSIFDLAGHAAEGTVQLVLITAVVALVATAVLYLATDPGGRPQLRAGLGAPARTVAIAVGTLVVPLVPILRGDVNRFFGGLGVLGILLAVALMVWWALYAIAAVYYLARTVVSIGEVHPMLAPICGVTAVLVKTAYDMVVGDTDGLPADLWMLLAIFGAATVTALGAAEYRALYRIGVRLTAGP